MADEQQTNERWASATVHVVGSILLVAFGAVAWFLASYFWEDSRKGGLLFLLADAALFIVACAVWAMALIHFSLGIIRRAIGPFQDHIRRQNQRTIELLEQIEHQLSISETAKRIISREHDRQTLSKTIRQDIEKGDYNAALALVETMAQTYGLIEDAEEFRRQIRTARAARLEETVANAFAALEAPIAKEQWESALAEAAKIEKLYPDSPRARTASKYVRDARESHKRKLERAFLEASDREDVEQAMKLLTQLDKYLTEQEAEPFREAARGVIAKKRRNLAVQFKLAVHDGEWSKAMEVGQEIIESFPNSKMAEEVHGMLALLRERAAGEREAARAAPQST